MIKTEQIWTMEINYSHPEGVVILKTIFPPEQSEYYSLVKKTRRAVKSAGVTKRSVTAAIKKARLNE